MICFDRRGIWAILGESIRMLTRKQYELLRFIHERLKEAGVPPSFDEMKEALQLRSKSGIHRLISALEERGFLHRRHHRARALEVMRLPEDLSPKPAPSQARGEDQHGTFTPNVIRGDFTARIAGVKTAQEA